MASLFLQPYSWYQKLETGFAESEDVCTSPILGLRQLDLTLKLFLMLSGC